MPWSISRPWVYGGNVIDFLMGTAGVFLIFWVVSRRD